MKCSDQDGSRFSPAVQARLKIADITGERNARTISDRIPPEVFAALSKRLNTLINSDDPTWLRLRQLYELAKEMNAYNGDNAACRRGCAHCCHIAVAMTPVEALMLGQAIGRKPKDDVATRGRDFTTMEYGYHTPCTFLKNNECSIYENRPMACRSLVNVDEDSLLCELTEPPGPVVPYLNRTNFDIAYVKICNTLRLADIRDYFPL